MCDPASAVLALKVGSDLFAGQAASSASKTNAALLERRASEERAAGKLDASRIRRRTNFERGEAIARFGASGLETTEGSAAEVQRFIDETGEEDALLALINSTRRARSAEFSAQAERSSGRSARISSLIDGTTSLLSGGAKLGFFKGT